MSKMALEVAELAILTITVTLTMGSSSRVIDKDTTQGQGYIFPKYDNNRFTQTHIHTQTEIMVYSIILDGRHHLKHSVIRFYSKYTID